MGLFSSKTKVPASGYYAMPHAYQSLWGGLLNEANSLLLPGGKLDVNAFKPLEQTAEEDRAQALINQGLAPTPESLQRDLAMLMNPFDEYVINDMNRQATGQNSLVNQYASRAGQQGSNRSFLGTSDVEQQRLNSIGQFRQSQYNNSINNILGPLSQLRQGDIDNLMNFGGFQRGLDMQTNMAPYTALGTAYGILNSVPTSFGNFGSPEQTIKTGGGLGGILGGIGSIAGTAIGGPLGGMIGGQLGSLAGGGGFSPSALFSGISGLGASSGLWGGLDPTTGITWNSGRSGGFF